MGKTLILAEIGDEYYAVTFGQIGRFLIDRDRIEPDFGLRAALNLVNQDELKRIATNRYSDITRRSESAASRNTQLRDFGIDPRRDVASAAAGRPVDTDGTLL